MFRLSHVAGAAAVLFACAPHAVLAQASPSPSPAPSASASPAATSDICDALSSLVSRPTVTTAACVAKPQAFLIETGYTNTTASGTGANSTVLYPQATLRIGLVHNLELDVAPGSIERISSLPFVKGVTDTSVGLKYEFGDTSKLVTSANVLYTANSGSDATSDNGDGVLANLNGALTLSPAVGLFATVGYNAQSAGLAGSARRYEGFNPSLGASFSLPAGFTIEAEGFGQSSTGPGLGGRYGADVSAEHDLGSRLQLDVNYYDYFGIQNGQHLHALGFGAAYLIGP